MSKSHFQVYAHYRADTGELFHIGKGIPSRAYKKSGRNNHWQRIVAKYGYYVKLHHTNLTEDKAWELEKLYISIFNPITNYHPGGSGGNTYSKLNDQQYTQMILKKQKYIKFARENNLFKNGKSHGNFNKFRGSNNGMYGKLPANAKSIRCIETGLIFNSSKEAALWCGGKSSNIRACCRGERKKAYTYTWEFLGE